MTTDYDPIAEQYRLAKQQAWRKYVEAHTFMARIGDPRGLGVIDIACGEGFYTRMIRHAGAARVTGVDMSEKMIGLARATESEQHLGINYAVGDGRRLDFRAEFDLAIAAYLLNYARNRAELDAMCSGIARCLKPGGRFVTVNSNPACDFSTAPSYRKYGFETAVVGPFREEAPITWTFHLEDGPFSIENYFLSVATHEQALHAAGFHEVRWHAPSLSPEGQEAFGQDYWSDLLRAPPFIFMECVLRA